MMSANIVLNDKQKVNYSVAFDNSTYPELKMSSLKMSNVSENQTRYDIMKEFESGVAVIQSTWSCLGSYNVYTYQVFYIQMLQTGQSYHRSH